MTCEPKVNKNCTMVWEPMPYTEDVNVNVTKPKWDCQNITRTIPHIKEKPVCHNKTYTKCSEKLNPETGQHVSSSIPYLHCIEIQWRTVKQSQKTSKILLPQF